MQDMKINAIVPPTSPAALPPETLKGEGGGFADLLKGAIHRVNSADLAADRSVEKLLQGRATITDTMLALQKADVSLRLTLAVRNKVLDAYREIMRMQF